MLLSIIPPCVLINNLTILISRCYIFLQNLPFFQDFYPLSMRLSHDSDRESNVGHIIIKYSFLKANISDKVDYFTTVCVEMASIYHLLVSSALYPDKPP